nr:adaptive-response sensory-kinase SasA [uncultured archaeon]
MIKLPNVTIKGKLIAIVMVVCLSSLVLTSFMLFMFVRITFRNSIIQDILTDAQMAAENCNVALAFKNIEDVEKTLASLKSKPSIIFGGVYTLDGENFARYYRESNNTSVQPARLGKDGYYFENDILTVFKSIVLGEEKIGTLCIRSDLGPLYIVFRNSFLVIIMVLCLALTVAYIMSARLQRVISIPILNLAEIAKVVSEEKDYSVRAAKKANDEVGLLIEAFNGMLEQIQQRDLVLRNTNEQLTKEVMVRNQAEQRQAELLEQLERTNQELKDFAYIVSHDLKAPLRGIDTLAKWISTDYADKFDQEGKEQMSLLMSRVDRMHNLIDGVLQYSRIGRVKEEKIQVNLNELVPGIIDLIAPPENIAITIENELPVIECEKTRISQVFQNLLSNAVKYMDKPQGQIRVGCIEEEESWKFNVTDNGPGIEEKYYEKECDKGNAEIALW